MTLDIFVPFWGDPALLRATVTSVLAQRNPGWRLTVIDDCYPDATIAQWFETLDDDRVSYVRNEANIGITENYRKAIRLASADHVTILGSDDLLHPNYVDVVLAALSEAPDADVVQPGVDVIDEHGRVIMPLADRVKHMLAPRGDGVTMLRGQRMATSLMRGDWLYWPSLTFRTETLRRTDFRDGLPIIQDLALLMDIAFADGSLAYTPTLAFSYRRHGKSASQRTLLDGQRFRDERRYLAEARQIAAAKGWRNTALTARVRLLSRLHGVTELPAVISRGSRAGIQSTLAHIFAP
ncbi:MAG: glycosyltransferase [Humibacter sp.]